MGGVSVGLSNSRQLRSFLQQTVREILLANETVANVKNPPVGLGRRSFAIDVMMAHKGERVASLLKRLGTILCC